MTQIVEIWSALFFVIIMVQIITKYDIMKNKQIRIEPNRCAMACQGCGAVFLFLNKKAVETKSYK